jgi:Cu/Zn superoxide dismutase
VTKLGAVVWAVLLLARPGVASAQTAMADLRAATGAFIGTVSFSQARQEVLISIAFTNRTALVGTHAVHIASLAQCDPPNFASAGASVRDLPNLVIGPAGVGVYNLAAPGATLDSRSTSLLGKSLVILRAEAGTERIACAAIAAQAADRPDLPTAMAIALLGGLLIAGGVLLRRGT